MKAITIAGNVGKDGTLRTTQNGDKVLGFSVAVEERTGHDKRTLWFDCSLWGKRAEALAQYLTKGTRVAVSGDLSTREHDGRTYLTVRANEVTLLGGGQDRQVSDGMKPAHRAAYDAQAPSGGASRRAWDDMPDASDVPF